MDKKYCDVQSLLKKDPQKLKEILQKVKENTKTKCINIRTKISSERLSTTCSKFGGLPYWPKNMSRPYPHTDGKSGLPLTMLAQINLSDLPENENDVFQDKGILQFFILNGMDTDSIEVVLHEQIEEPIVFTRSGPIIHFSMMPREITITEKSGEKKTVPNLFWGGYDFPITGELALEFSKVCDFVNVTENCFDKEFIKAAKQLNVQISDDFCVYPLPDECGDEWYEIGCGHKLLGRPCFVQNDYRDGEDKDDVLLFQIDSAFDTGEEDSYNNINLGDSGTTGFFIKPEDLKKLDFSNVFFDWSCC